MKNKIKVTDILYASIVFLCYTTHVVLIKIDDVTSKLLGFKLFGLMLY